MLRRSWGRSSDRSQRDSHADQWKELEPQGDDERISADFVRLGDDEATDVDDIPVLQRQPSSMPILEREESFFPYLKRQASSSVVIEATQSSTRAERLSEPVLPSFATAPLISQRNAAPRSCPKVVTTGPEVFLLASMCQSRATPSVDQDKLGAESAVVVPGELVIAYKPLRKSVA
ncbi:hypothetical protein ACHHYP_20010 [Achlya hypogyna]|uniref:Uncharacterized protein n=1 Tax=Achlya hypogyna TaxID=1202772 RepID=A0A1V9ZB13_ACHHY|nr:hypothetical protein ACHHYP_20010 [Achlya hypogyna]